MNCEILTWAVVGALCGYALGQVLVLLSIMAIDRYRDERYRKARK